MMSASENPEPLGTSRIIEIRRDVVQGSKNHTVVVEGITPADGEENE